MNESRIDVQQVSNLQFADEELLEKEIQNMKQQSVLEVSEIK